MYAAHVGTQKQAPYRLTSIHPGRVGGSRDRDGSPKGRDREAGSVRSTTARPPARPAGRPQSKISLTRAPTASALPWAGGVGKLDPSCQGPPAVVTISGPRAYKPLMRFVLAALLSLAVGLLPMGTARAEAGGPAHAQSMSCHDMDMGVGGHDMGGDQPAGHDMQKCAEHCLSQVNGQPAVAPVAAPSLMNAISATALGGADLGKPHLSDPPDPPPPRI